MINTLITADTLQTE